MSSAFSSLDVGFEGQMCVKIELVSTTNEFHRVQSSLSPVATAANSYSGDLSILDLLREISRSCIGAKLAHSRSVVHS